MAALCPLDQRPPVSDAESPHTVLALGGGGMKGMAHVGAIRALQAAGIAIDAVVGTSIGALIGARFAMGSPLSELEAEALAVTESAVLRRNVRAFLLGGVAQTGLYDGEHYRRLVGRVLAAGSFASLKIPLRVNALSLCKGEERWFGWGADRSLNLVDAVYASGALPLIFPPLETADGDILVDGGLRTMVGVADAVRWGAERVIAVDVSDLFDPEEAGWRRMGLAGIHGRVVQVLSEAQREAIRGVRAVPVLHIRPDVQDISAFTFSATPRLLEAGEAAARSALVSAEAVAFRAAVPTRHPRVRRAPRSA
ncbi:MAG: patatin-like phospholipase family protein [Gemmatimonadaceae bacterium]